MVSLSCNYTNLFWFLSISLVILSSISAKKITDVTEDNCEVCVKFMKNFISSLDEQDKKSQDELQRLFKKTCKKGKHDDNRFCYYVGGLEESATGMLGEITRPIGYSMPAEKICMNLYRKDNQICDLKYEKKFDLTKVEFKKLKVADLKHILSDWNEECRGCTEKSEYVRLVKSLLPTYAPEAAQARTDL